MAAALLMGITLQVIDKKAIIIGRNMGRIEDKRPPQLNIMDSADLAVLGKNLRALETFT